MSYKLAFWWSSSDFYWLATYVPWYWYARSLFFMSDLLPVSLSFKFSIANISFKRFYYYIFRLKLCKIENWRKRFSIFKKYFIFIFLNSLFLIIIGQKTASYCMISTPGRKWRWVPESQKFFDIGGEIEVNCWWWWRWTIWDGR